MASRSQPCHGLKGDQRVNHSSPRQAMDHRSLLRLTQDLHPDFCFPIEATVLGNISPDIRPLIYLYWHHIKLTSASSCKTSKILIFLIFEFFSFLRLGRPTIKAEYEYQGMHYLPPKEALSYPSGTPSWPACYTPFSAAFDSNGNLFVLEADQDRILVFNPDATFLRSFGQQGSQDGEFASPIDLAFDHDGNLFVLDNRNHRVQKFDPKNLNELKFLLKWGKKGSGQSEFNDACGLVIGIDGNVIIADSSNDRIQVRFFFKALLGY